MDDVERIKQRTSAEVLAACIKSVSEAKQIWLSWHDLTRLGKGKEYADAAELIVDRLRNVQPAASDLEALLREERIKERLCVLRENPGLCNGDIDNPERHSRCCKYHQELAELEKARASEGDSK